MLRSLGLLILVPFAVVAVFVLARIRPSRSLPRSAAEVGILLGTLPWLWMIFTPVRLDRGTVTVYLIPLSDLAAQLGSGKPFYVMIQVGGNLMVLAAFGALAPLRVPALANPIRLALAGLIISTAIEVMQHLFVGGRVFSVDDIMLNTVGCLVGGLLSRRWWTPRLD